MDMHPYVREASAGDAAILAELVTQLGYPAEAGRVAARLATLHAEGHSVLVAEVEGSVVGAIHVQRLANLVLDDAAEVGALVVDEKWRGQRIGRALLEAAEEWARRKGCTALHVRTNITRRRAHGFYVRNGFQQVKTSLTLVKPL